MNQILLPVTRRQLAGLYITLKDDESEHSEDMRALFDHVRELLFGFMSIDEMERIDQLYEEGYRFGNEGE